MVRVERVAVGRGTPEGVNSAYVLPDLRVVVDPGPPGEGAWEDLVTGVAAAGLEPTDVDHVFVSHWHVDHAGLAPRLADAADATLHMHDADAPLVGEYREERRRRLQRDAARMREWGVPTDVASAVVDSDSPSPLPDRTPVTTHSDGDVVAGVEVLHTPGHTAGHAAFAVEDALFVGDAVLATYTPNVGGGDTRQRDPLHRYFTALDRLVARAQVALPGHGTPFSLEERVSEIRDHHADRQSRVLDAVEAAEGPMSPWDVACDLFGEMRGVHAKFGAGEAAAHLARLVTAGDVTRYNGIHIKYEPS